MTFILFLIFAITIFGVMMVFSLIRGVASFIFGKPTSSFSGYQSNDSYTNGNHDNNAAKNDERKVFSKNEGEYIKFEEIKE